MTNLIVDAATRAKLHNLDGFVEVCDEAGNTLGYFHLRQKMAAPLSPMTNCVCGGSSAPEAPWRKFLTGYLPTEIAD